MMKKQNRKFLLKWTMQHKSTFKKLVHTWISYRMKNKLNSHRKVSKMKKNLVKWKRYYFKLSKHFSNIKIRLKKLLKKWTLKKYYRKVKKNKTLKRIIRIYIKTYKI